MNTIEELKGTRQEHPLRQTLLKAGITTEEVALYLGVSARTVQNWLRGSYQPKAQQEKELQDLKIKIETELTEQASC